MELVRGQSSIYKTLGGRKYRIADFIMDVAEDIRAASKAKDMHFPISRLLMLISGLQKIRYEMLEREMKLDRKARNLWPKL